MLVPLNSTLARPSGLRRGAVGSRLGRTGWKWLPDDLLEADTFLAPSTCRHRGCSTQTTGPIGPPIPYVSWHGQWASNQSSRSSRTAGWASLLHSHSLLCIWLATAGLPSMMRPGRSGVLIRLVQSNEKRDDVVSFRQDHVDSPRVSLMMRR